MENHYFYNPDLKENDKKIILIKDEFHHLHSVLRLKEPDTVFVLNGEGVACEGRIKNKAKDTAEIDILNSSFTKRKSNIILLQSLIKKEAMEIVVEKAQELGVTTFQPVIAERSVVKIRDSKSSQNKIRRWGKIAVEAMKQCSNPYLMKIEQPLLFNEAIAKYKGQKFALKIEAEQLDISSVEQKDSIVLLTGPEGDLTEAEYSQAERCGFKPVSLGSLRLRSETASIAAVSFFKICADSRR